MMMIAIFITFMQSIYNYLPEINYASKVHNVTVILRLCFMVHVMIFFIINVVKFCIRTFRSICAVPSVVVFCSSSMSWFPGILLRYFLNNSVIFPVISLFTGITFVFTFHIQCIPTVWYLYLKTITSSFSKC
jgi:hypothetical protein